MSLASLRDSGPVRSLVVTSVLLVAAVQVPGSTASQQEQRPPVFRAGATFVRVDVYPRRDGAVIEGLRAEDFQLLEDGKPQAVETFEFVRILPNTPDADRRDPNTVADAERQARDPHNRLFVVYLDLYHTTLTGSHSVRQPIVDFVSRAIGASDLFAVTSPEMPPGMLTFGRRGETLEAELAKYWTWGEANRLTVMPRTAAERRLAECTMILAARLPSTDPNFVERMVERILLLGREDALFTSLEALVTRLGSLRDERKNVLLLTGAFVPKGPQEELLKLLGNDLPAVGVGPGGRIGLGGAEKAQGTPAIAACNAELARIVLSDFDRRFRSLLVQAVQANVAFFPIDTEGLRVSAGAGVDTLRTLAENTSGVALVDSNDLGRGLRKIADDLSSFYLLGYYSSNSNADGRFRRIEVKLARSGAQVDGRRGYLALTEAMRRAEAAAAARPASAPSPANDALAALSRLRPDAALHTYAAWSPEGVNVVVELGSRELAGGGWRGGGAVTVTVVGTGGAPVTAEGRLEPAARSVLLQVRTAVPTSGVWRASVRMTGGGGSLDETSELRAEPARLLTMPLVYRATPSPRSPLLPVADLSFRRTERIHVETTAAAATTARSARLLDRRGEALAMPLAVTERTDGDRIVLYLDLPLAALPEADYAIALQATANGETDQRFVAFRVVR